MATTTPTGRDGSITGRVADADPGRLAFLILRTGFTVAPILFGVDKFFDWMVDWERYLWSGISDFFPGTAEQIMVAVGVIEIAAGVAVLIVPLVGGALVTFWLGTIVTNLVIVGIAEGEFWDIALRDFGLMLGALTLTVLATRYGPLGSRRGQP